MRGIWKIVVGLAVVAAAVAAALAGVAFYWDGAAIAVYGAVVVGALLAGFGLIQALSQGATTPEARERRRAKPAMEALVQSMYFVAVADGRIHGSEVALVRSILERELGLKVTDKDVDKYLRDFAKVDNAKALEAHLSFMGTEIEEDRKQLILKYGYLVALSDGELHVRERGAFNRLVGALAPKAQTTEAAIREAKAAYGPGPAEATAA